MILRLPLCLSFLLAVGAPGAYAAAPLPAVEIVVPGQDVVLVDAAALATLPVAEVVDASHDEPPSRWTGVALVDVLRMAKLPLDRRLRGSEHAKVVRLSAADGYQVVFSVAELDPGFGNRRVLLVNRRNGRPLDTDGPFRLVVPDDQRAGRWLRNLVRIEVLDVATHPTAITP